MMTITTNHSGDIPHASSPLTGREEMGREEYRETEGWRTRTNQPVENGGKWLYIKMVSSGLDGRILLET
jgi:hypothetical protein